MNTPDQVYTLLRDAMLKAKADGLRIVQGTFGDGVKTCCAVNAVMRFPLDEFNITKAALKLSIDVFDAGAIADGFDDNDCNRHSDFYAVGQRLRAEFIEGVIEGREQA